MAKGASLEGLMGSEIDAQKLVSSLTLFEHVARRLLERPGQEALAPLARSASRVLDEAARLGRPRCRFTSTALGAGPSAT